MMRETFTASNGKEIVDRDGGLVTIDEVWLGEDDLHAIHEYVQANLDRNLGRERDSEWPEYVSYRNPHDPDLVRVLNEDDGTSNIWQRREVRKPLGPDASKGQVVAHHYFKAHPEPEPWEEAADGEVWLLEFESWFSVSPRACIREGKNFYHGALGFEAGGDFITAGRRIWPEPGAEPVDE